MTYYGSKTIDLNGFKVTANNSSGVLFAPYVSDYKMTLQNSAENQGHYVCEYLQVYNDGTLAIPAENNNLTISAVLIKSDGNANLAGGSFGKISVEGEKTLAGLLVSGYYFADTASGEPAAMYDADGTALTELTNVTVQPCSHDTAVCDANGVWKCLCGQNVFVASVTKDGTPTYYTDLQNAFSAADGNTVKLMANVRDVTVSTDKPFTFDLNGYNVYLLTVNNKITIKDSATVKGKITEWLEVPSGMTVGELLEDGYAFKKSSGMWCSEAEQAGQAVGDVSIWPVPIRSVTAANPSVTVAYGQTSGVTLTATVVPFAEGGTVSYQWYEIGGTDFPIQDATENTYQLPADLGAGTHTYRLTATSDGYPKSVDITVKVTPISLEGAEVTVKDLTYNGERQLPTVTVKLDENTTLTKNTDFDVDATMQTNAGSYTLTISGNGNYTGTKTVEWKILPKTIANPTIEVGSGGIYDKTAKTPSVVVKDDGTSIPDSEYTVSYENNTNAGTATVKITDKENGNYTVNCSSTFEIQKAPALILETINVTATAGVAKTITVPLTGLMPEDANISGYVTGTMNGFALVSGDNIEPHFIYDVTEDSTKGTITATVTIKSQNYEDSTATVSLTLTPKAIPVGAPTLSKSVLTYGDKLGDITLSGSMMDREAAVEGTFSWASPEDKPSTTEKYVAKWVFTPKDKNTYATVHGETNITVNKATPTGKPEYTAITTSGKKLSDASLTQTETSFSVPGTVAWKLPADTEVTANTAYEWVFTPNDTDNYNTLTGTITLWHKSSSGSSSGAVTPGTKTDTVKNPDGSTTKTETKADGSKTETTTASSGGGSTGTTVTKTDAKGNTTTEASAKLSDRDVKEAQEKGEAVTVPVKEIEAAKDANAAAKIKIDVPNNADKTTVEIPVENVTSGTVAVIVHEDGTEELVKDSKPTEGGVQLELSGSTTVKIIDNSKTFDDTKDHWSRDEVNFVAARELFNGVGGNQFGVSEPMTRGMVNTVLARLAGVDTTPSQGQAWYEVGTDWAKKNGISDGTDPTAPVTREQLATLLYRYAGSPSVSGTLHAADAASVSDYAKDALLWANQNGIVNGVGSNTIAPKDNAQRAQVAAMLARYLQNQ